VAAFLAALPGEVRERYAGSPELEALLAQLVATAAVAAGDVARFLGDVAARLPPDEPPARALAAIRAADLALATACARGEPAALARFEAAYADQVAQAHRRYRGAPVTLDELRQAVRERLLVAAPGTAPRIASYQGRGELGAWVRMVAVRHLLDLVRADGARPDRPGGDDAFADRAIAGDDPELAFLKRQYRDAFRAAFGRALAGLEPRDRNILRHRYLDGLEVAEVATIYGMHRVSMSRVLGRLRDELLSAVRREFLGKLGLGAEELEGVMGLIGSQLELSLSRLLKSS
jgi:RNA polymerase sigma-70 factor (ECF subfamily)